MKIPLTPLTSTCLMRKIRDFKFSVKQYWYYYPGRHAGGLYLTNSHRVPTFVTEHEETRLKTQFPIVYNAHIIMVKSAFYFVLKSILYKRQQRKKIFKIMQVFFVNLFSSAVFIFHFCKNLIFVSKAWFSHAQSHLLN